jgi:hypothetical protein
MRLGTQVPRWALPRCTRSFTGHRSRQNSLSSGPCRLHLNCLSMTRMHLLLFMQVLGASVADMQCNNVCTCDAGDPKTVPDVWPNKSITPMLCGTPPKTCLVCSGCNTLYPCSVVPVVHAEPLAPLTVLFRLALGGWLLGDSSETCGCGHGNNAVLPSGRFADFGWSDTWSPSKCAAHRYDDEFGAYFG